MTNHILDIIRELNGGSIIIGQADEICKVDLFTDDANLYVDESNSKYYYFADLVIDENDYRKSNLGQIEKSTVKNPDAYITVAPPTPSSSYLILFWKVVAINESIYPQIIRLEENEFFFKKYVFYYTQEELDAFVNWFSEMSSAGKGCLSDLLEELSGESVNFDAPHVSFLVRLLIKIPFWNLVFPQAVLRDFDDIVSSKITSTRGNTGEKVKELDSTITKAIASGAATVDAISDIIYKTMMEG